MLGTSVHLSNVRVISRSLTLHSRKIHVLFHRLSGGVDVTRKDDYNSNVELLQYCTFFVKLYYEYNVTNVAIND